jgi:hypothetical protein
MSVSQIITSIDTDYFPVSHPRLIKKIYTNPHAGLRIQNLYLVVTIPYLLCIIHVSSKKNFKFGWSIIISLPTAVIIMFPSSTLSPLELQQRNTNYEFSRKHLDSYRCFIDLGWESGNQSVNDWCSICDWRVSFDFTRFKLFFIYPILLLERATNDYIICVFWPCINTSITNLMHDSFILYHTYCYRIKELCIKVVIEISMNNYIITYSLLQCVF